MGISSWTAPTFVEGIAGKLSRSQEPLRNPQHFHTLSETSRSYRMILPCCGLSPARHIPQRSTRPCKRATTAQILEEVEVPVVYLV